MMWPVYHEVSSFVEVDKVLDFIRVKLVYAKKINRFGKVWCRVFQIEVY